MGRCAEWWVRHAWGFRSVAVGLGHFLFAPPGQVGDVALSLVTNAPRVNADMMLAELGMDEIFGDDVVLGEECARAKPFPDPYLTAMKRLGVDADASIVFEDTGKGIQAGVQAGAGLVVGIASSSSAEDLIRAGARVVIDNYLQCTVDRLGGVLAWARTAAPGENLGSPYFVS